jgi:hypothetical protein
VLDHLDDIASDMSVFHRIDDISELDGPSFLRLAWRLPAYTGVMAARVAAAQQEADTRSTPQGHTGYGRSAQEINPGTQAALASEPAFSGVFSFG